MSGPLWSGTLHDTTYLNEMLTLAEEWGWTHSGKDGVVLEKLLIKMIEESDPELPFGFIKLDEVLQNTLNVLLLLIYTVIHMNLSQLFYILIHAVLIIFQIARRAKLNSPPMSTIINTMKQVNY